MDRGACAKFIEGLRNPDGGFAEKENCDSDMESTRFAVDCLNLLGRPLPRAKDCVRWIGRCYNGRAFGAKPGSRPRPSSTYYAVRSLSLIARVHDFRATANWIQTYRHTDGGYRISLRSPCSHIDPTFYSVCSLEMLGFQVDASVKAFLDLCWRQDGGYAPDATTALPSLEATYCALKIQKILKISASQPRKIVSWILDHRRQGPFVEAYFEPIVTTYWTIHSLAILRQRAPNPTEIGDWLRSCQGRKGGFRATPGDRREELWFTYCALHSLALIHHQE